MLQRQRRRASDTAGRRRQATSQRGADLQDALPLPHGNDAALRVRPSRFGGNGQAEKIRQAQPIVGSEVENLSVGGKHELGGGAGRRSIVESCSPTTPPLPSPGTSCPSSS